MIKLVICLIMLVIAVGLITALIINGIRRLLCGKRQQDCSHINGVLKKNGLLIVGVLVIMVIYIWTTQLRAYTPSIRDKDGNIVSGSVAELKKVSVNGHNEWLSIRGQNKKAPIILFLAGGPGGTQMAATRYALSDLEKDYVVVNWDQPGSGKSYGCMDTNDITVQTYIDDGIAVTDYLRKRFKQDKIYVMGESWGSALGIFLVHKKPEYYKGFIGTGQMVDFQKTDQMDYDKAIQIAKDKGDDDKVQSLKDTGKPPYYKGNISMTYNGYLQYLTDYMKDDPNITNGGYKTLRDMFAPEYDLVDSYHYLIALMKTFNVVYPQLQSINLRDGYTKLAVPVYFFVGRHDINAPATLTEEYYQMLDAPEKKLVWFEHSGHSPWINESERFVKETKQVFQ